MKINMIMALWILSVGVVAQDQKYSTGEITDIRDGKTYKTVKINNTIWLSENMKFKTKDSEVILENNFGIHTDGYYYPYYESDEVCPADFELPRDSDWKAYVDYIINLTDTPKSSVKHFSHKTRKVTGVATQISDSNFSFFEDPNPLNLIVSEMIQGDNFVSDNALNFWSRMEDSNDIKYHLHIEKNEYGNHSHKHHIHTKKNKKRRKFVVRCIKR